MAAGGSGLALLLKVKEAYKRGSVQLGAVEEALATEPFSSGAGLHATTDNGNTLLHFAANAHDASILPLVSQAYNRARLFPTAMRMQNSRGMNPLHLAIKPSKFENTVLLYKECMVQCPEVLQPSDSGWTLLHSTVEGHDNLSILKFFLSQAADLCQAMLLSKWASPKSKRDCIPLDIARDLVVSSEFQLKTAIQHLAFTAKNNKYDERTKMTFYGTTVEPKKKAVEKAKEIYSTIEQPTLELKAKEAQKTGKKLQEQKFREREDKIGKEIKEHIENERWDTVVQNYLLLGDEEIQTITVACLAGLADGQAAVLASLPPLSTEVLSVLVSLLTATDDMRVPSSALKLLGGFANTEDNCKVIFEGPNFLGFTGRVIGLMCSLGTDVQRLCVELLLALCTRAPPSVEVNTELCESWIQPLLLVKHFSLDDTAKQLAAECVGRLGGGRMQPDPGSWTVEQVAFWMQRNTELEKRTEYQKNFASAGIDGLHLLELSVAEMTGLGVKFLTNQRKLTSLIDELRRMNVRSVVGQKDVFLSYAHIQIHFAKRIKKVLNEGHYTVWIDQAGIRAGQKWRNEIADGIQGCRALLFVMTPRSVTSEYCQDELALAEEYHKPILTVKLQPVVEMDPGLKLMVQRRQWIDFSEDAVFAASAQEMVDAMQNTIGDGSGAESDDDSAAEAPRHNPDRIEKHVEVKAASDIHADKHAPTSVSLTEVQELLRSELSNLRKELSEGVAKQVREELKQGLAKQVREELKQGLAKQVREELKQGLAKQVREELKQGLVREVREELRRELKEELS